MSAAFVHGRLSGLRLVDREAPALPGGDWVRIRVLLCGICGSDLGNVAYRSSPAMEPFGSFPAVLGHEILGRVIEAGPGVTHVKAGDRVVVDPMLHCEARGWSAGSWCRSCRGGMHATCELAGERGPDGGPWPGGLAAGSTIGYHRDLPGGWGEEMVAHGMQVFAVPDAVPDRVAVLAEPLSIGVHGVLGSGALQASGPVLVIGSGAIAFGTIWALRTLGHEGRVVAQARRPRERDLAVKLGADQAVAPGGEARQELIDTGAHAYIPVIGPEVYAGGGFDVVFDCVGSQESMAQALGFAAPRGRVVLLGCAGRMRSLDLTFVWARELTDPGPCRIRSRRVERAPPAHLRRHAGTNGGGPGLAGRPGNARLPAEAVPGRSPCRVRPAPQRRREGGAPSRGLASRSAVASRHPPPRGPRCAGGSAHGLPAPDAEPGRHDLAETGGVLPAAGDEPVAECDHVEVPRQLDAGNQVAGRIEDEPVPTISQQSIAQCPPLHVHKAVAPDAKLRGRREALQSCPAAVVAHLGCEGSVARLPVHPEHDFPGTVHGQKLRSFRRHGPDRVAVDGDPPVRKMPRGSWPREAGRHVPRRREEEDRTDFLGSRRPAGCGRRVGGDNGPGDQSVSCGDLVAVGVPEERRPTPFKTGRRGAGRAGGRLWSLEVT